MSKRGNGFLLNKNFATNRAMLSFGKTGVYTVGCNCFVDNLSVTLGGSKLNLTYGTNLRIFAICLCTGSMSKRGNGFLLNKNFATNRAMLSFGKTGVYTVGCNCFVNHLGVALCRNDFLLNKYLLTLSANLTFGESAFGTGRILGRKNSCIKMSAFSITNKSAVITALIVFIVVCMRDYGSNVLLNKNFATSRAMLTLGKTRRGTGCINRRINHLGVTLSGSKLNLTYGTNLCVKTICLITCSMSKCSNNRLCNLIVASVAMLSLCQTVFCTGGSLSDISNNIMIECRNLLLIYKDFATILT